MSSIYPTTGHRTSPYYVEFDRGNRSGEFTIFRRQWLDSGHPLDVLDEVHPWNIFTSQYGLDGCVPDRLWVRWMVDAMNNQHKTNLKLSDDETKDI